MTPAEACAEIEELLKKATPGPWIFDDSNGIEIRYGNGYVEQEICRMNNALKEVDLDATLICFLRNNIESLLAERKRLRESLKGMTEAYGADMVRVDSEKYKRTIKALQALGSAE